MIPNFDSWYQDNIDRLNSLELKDKLHLAFLEGFKRSLIPNSSPLPDPNEYTPGEVIEHDGLKYFLDPKSKQFQVVLTADEHRFKMFALNILREHFNF